MIYQNTTLESGLRIVHMPVNSPVFYCGFAINTGSRDESEEIFGMAHFTEHMIFKGTKKRSSYNILNRMERVGGDLNAYTSKEETFVYSIFLKENFDRACQLLCDLVVNSTFPAKEIEKEVGVIVDEINSYRDNPPEMIYDEFENMIFAGHSMGHNILGDEKTLESFDSAKGVSFLKERYIPEKMVFFTMGDLPFDSIVKSVAKYYEPDSKSNHPVPKREMPEEYNKAFRKEELDTYQSHVIIGGRAYNMFDEKRYSLALLNNILGGPGMNSRLNVSMREKRGYVYNVESVYTPYTDTGVFSIYFGSDQKKTEKCISLINSELKTLRDKKLSSIELERAKRQIKGQLGVATDNRENVCMNMAKAFLHFNKYDSLETVCKEIDAVTESQILECANEIMDDSKLSTLIFQ
ncbi:MAG: pitrilysin family protein [Bacteroidales bacterium]|nr:pitrilysin family protein [Bacteroidales bacterium]